MRIRVESMGERCAYPGCAFLGTKRPKVVGGVDNLITFYEVNLGHSAYLVENAVSELSSIAFDVGIIDVT